MEYFAVQKQVRQRLLLHSPSYFGNGSNSYSRDRLCFSFFSSSRHSRVAYPAPGTKVPIPSRIQFIHSFSVAVPSKVLFNKRTVSDANTIGGERIDARWYGQIL